MPTYELTCASCGHRFETFLTRILRDEDKVCPVCDSRQVTSGFGGGFLGKGTSTTASQASSCGVGGFT